MSAAPEPYLISMIAFLEEPDLAMGKAVIAGVTAEVLSKGGVSLSEPDWSEDEHTAAADLGPVAIGAGPGGRVDVTVRPAEVGVPIGAAVTVLAEMMRALHEEGIACEARLDRRGNQDLFPLPLVPLFGASHGIVVSPDEFMASYERRALLGDIDGVEIVEAHGRILMLRALGIGPEDAFLAAIHDGQLELARGARPGTTAYRPGPWPDWAMQAIRTGEPALCFKGVSDGQATWRCDTPPGRHVRGWELAEMLAISTGGQSPDGAPVSGLRVIFDDQMRALSERRPLCDIGAEILLDLGERGLRPIVD